MFLAQGHSMFLAEWTLTPQAGHDIAKSMLVKRLMTYRSLKVGVCQKVVPRAIHLHADLVQHSALCRCTCGALNLLNAYHFSYVCTFSMLNSGFGICIISVCR